MSGTNVDGFLGWWAQERLADPDRLKSREHVAMSAWDAATAARGEADGRYLSDLHAEVDRAHAEAAKLRTENERLKAMVSAFVLHLDKPDTLVGELRRTSDGWVAERDALRAVAGELKAACEAICEAHLALFVQCLSNPIKNAWGAQVNVSALDAARAAVAKWTAMTEAQK